MSVKYEIVLILAGSLSSEESENLYKKLTAKISELSEYSNNFWGKKKLAYEINKNKEGYYYIINLVSNEYTSLKELKDLSNLNSNVLRCEIFNLEKEYGYKSSINDKKIARNKLVAEKNKNRYLKNNQNINNNSSEETKHSGESSDTLHTKKRRTIKISDE